MVFHTLVDGRPMDCGGELITNKVTNRTRGHKKRKKKLRKNGRKPNRERKKTGSQQNKKRTEEIKRGAAKKPQNVYTCPMSPQRQPKYRAAGKP